MSSFAISATTGALSALIVMLCGCERRVEIYRDRYVIVGEIRRPLDTYLVHISRPKYITVRDQTFFGVRGLSPFYLRIPDKDAILFVTEGRESSVFFHLYDKATDRLVNVDGKRSTFGGNIGTKRSDGEPYTDWIEVAAADELVLASRADNMKVLTRISIAGMIVESVEALYLDSRGMETNRVVYRASD